MGVSYGEQNKRRERINNRIHITSKSNLLFEKDFDRTKHNERILRSLYVYTARRSDPKSYNNRRDLRGVVSY